MSIDSYLQETTLRLTTSNIASARLDAELLLMHVFGKSKTWLIAHGSQLIDKKQLSRLETLVSRRLQREPVAYLVGHKEFYGRDFIVTHDVLVPRPETEDLITLVRSLHQGGTLMQRMLEVGTGSGCLGLTLALETNARLTVCDISKAALTIARKNAKKLEVKPVRFIQSDLLEHWRGHDKPKPFDLVVANLPYVDRSWNDTSPELAYEPDVALYAKDGGLELIKRLIDQVPVVLSPNGFLLLEADPTQHKTIVKHTKNFVHINTLGYALLLQSRQTS